MSSDARIAMPFYISVINNEEGQPSPEMGSYPTRAAAERRMWEIQEEVLYWQGRLEVKESKS